MERSPLCAVRRPQIHLRVRQIRVAVTQQPSRWRSLGYVDELVGEHLANTAARTQLAMGCAEIHVAANGEGARTQGFGCRRRRCVRVDSRSVDRWAQLWRDRSLQARRQYRALRCLAEGVEFRWQRDAGSSHRDTIA